MQDWNKMTSATQETGVSRYNEGPPLTPQYDSAVMYRGFTVSVNWGYPETSISQDSYTPSPYTRTQMEDINTSFKLSRIKTNSLDLIPAVSSNFKISYLYISCYTDEN